jgi:glycosyltransferase involved in cell wall biosynthesis
MCKVSVIIPTYNCAEWIERAVRSVASHSAANTEIIIVDDGSRDNTSALLAPWAASGTVKYIFQENHGLPASRNTGARAARGEYLAFLDADDALVPDAIGKMCEAMDRSRASWCLVDIVRVSDSGSEVQQTVVPDGDLFHGILEYNFIRRGMFFRRDAIFEAGLYDEAIRMCEDWELNIRMFEQRRPFVHIPEPLYLYTKREGSITTGRVAENLSYTEQVFRKHHKRLADGGDRVVRHLYAAHMWDTARKYWYLGNMRGAALQCARESLAYEFNIGRLFHPVLYKTSKAFNTGRSDAMKQAG